MSDQIQIFWDPYLQSYIIEVPEPDLSPSEPPPIVVTPDDFQAPPTNLASFVRDPNAALGSFTNPHPYIPSATATATVPEENRNMAAAGAATAIPPTTNPWLRDSSAPVGSLQNPHPYVTPTSAPASAPESAPASAPAPVVAPAPSSTTTLDYTGTGFHHLAPQDQPWQPSAADIDALFNTIQLLPPKSNPQASTPQAPPQRSPPQPSPPHPDSSQQPSTQTQTSDATSSARRRRRRPRSRSRSHSHGRHLRFASPDTRALANAEAAARANLIAIQNEIETRAYIDAFAPMPHHRPPTPMPIPPMMSGALNPPATQPPALPPQPTSAAYPSAQPSHSRSSSTASTIDPLTATHAPIPAAPSRNPGFHDPRRGEGSPATVGRAEQLEEVEFEVWPLCAVCEDRPATIQKSGIRFCDGCFGQAWAAEGRRRG
ncbi:MAG: hypothetical protein L6R40_005728 [Gallowayella cf. fulva]|nr:MAG: hypothetical protein L6R40_005728 [Xanthomendoza cf. fulva]